MSNRRMTFPVIVALILLGILTAAITATAQVRKYHRKSVSSVNSVLFAVSPQKELADVVTNRLKFHLEVPRFDYNEIPQNIVGDFASVAGRTDHSAGSIAAALDKTVIPTVQEVVSTMAEYRAVYNLSEEQLAIAAVDKMKGSGLTVEDVLKVMNSAYIYLPVVTSYGETSKEGSVTSTIEGYVLWYHVKRDSTGTYRAFLVSDLKDYSRGEGSGKESGTYNLKTRSVDGRTYATVLAVDTWARNLAVKMKAMPDFRLSAEVKNVEGRSLEAALGKKEGLGLDDGYNVIDFYQDDNGRVRAKGLGFMRAGLVADNAGEPNSLSRFDSYIGGEFGRGMLLYERPRLGMDITIQPKFFTTKIPRYATPVIDPSTFLRIYNSGGLSADYASPLALDQKKGGHGFILKEDAKSGFGVDVNFNANLAKLTGIRQLFLNLDLSVGLPNASIDADALKSAQIAPLILSGYLGPMKKLWFGRSNISLAIAGGVDMLRLQNTTAQNGDLDNLSVIAPGLKANIGLEILLTSDWSFGFNAGYKVGLSPLVATIAFKGDSHGDYDITPILGNGFFSGFSDMKFSGLSVSAGISYALPSFGFNPFGFLSSTQIDY